MLSVLIPVFLCLVARVIRVRNRAGTGMPWDIRDRLIVACVATAFWAFIGAEFLSLFTAFAFPGVLLWWGLPIVAIVIWQIRSPLPWMFPAERPTSDGVSRYLIAIGVGLLLLTGIVSALTPPTTWDCLGYHMPRQINWIENRSVAICPTRELRQVEMPPLAEYIGAQLMVLSGNDHQANLVQWFSYLMTALASSAIARDFGARHRGQVFAALLALTNPAAATQAENPKNDLVIAVWLLALTWLATRLWISRRWSLLDAAIAGVTLGLLLATKGTAYLIGAPICAVIALGVIRVGSKRAVALGAVVTLIAAAINVPQWHRNYVAFGSPLSLPAAKGGHDLANSTISASVVVSNLLRNLTLHTNGPGASFNNWQRRVVAECHKPLTVDVDDVRTTLAGFKYTVDPGWFTDGASGAPVHVILGVALLLLWRPRGMVTRIAWPVRVAPLLSMVLFAAALKWQPWHARLHIPIVAAMAPVIASRFDSRRWLMAVSVSAAAFTAAIGILYNKGKPLVGEHSILGKTRHEILFQTQPYLMPAAEQAVAAVQRLHPRLVSLDVQPFTCEYALMRVVLDNVQPRPALRTLRPIFGKLPLDDTVRPDAAIVCYLDAQPPVLQDKSSGEPLVHITDAGRFRVYLPEILTPAIRKSLPFPVFYGWTDESGMQPPEGPYPALDLPLVRWGIKQEMTLRFYSDGSPMVFIMECRRNDRSDQAFTVSLDGDSLGHEDLGDQTEFVRAEYAMPTSEGAHTVTINCANLNEPGAPRSILIRKLQIIRKTWAHKLATGEWPSSP
jgi:hypothetical protein